MFVNERTKPLRISQLEAVLNRIPKNHPQILTLEKDLAIRKSGFRGEKNLDYHLSFLPKDKNYKIIRGIRLKLDHYFQIDTLLITPYYALIMEVKSISGLLYIDPYTHQLIRTIGEKEETFQNPIFQARRQQLQLKEWLQKQKCEPLPIEYIAVFQEGHSIFNTKLMDKSLFQKITYAENIFQKIEAFDRKYQTMKQLDDKEIRKIIKKVLNNHEELATNILDEYGLSPNVMKRGVQCPHCRGFGMKWVSCSWRCPACQKASKTAHIGAIEEFLVMNGSITNHECKYFLMLSSSDTAYRLLTALPLTPSGQRKVRKYHLCKGL